MSGADPQSAMLKIDRRRRKLIGAGQSRWDSGRVTRQAGDALEKRVRDFGDGNERRSSDGAGSAGPGEDDVGGLVARRRAVIAAAGSGGVSDVCVSQRHGRVMS